MREAKERGEQLLSPALERHTADVLAVRQQGLVVAVPLAIIEKGRRITVKILRSRRSIMPLLRGWGRHMEFQGSSNRSRD